MSRFVLSRTQWSDPKVGMLRRIDVFARCEERELRLLATQTDLLRAPAGAALTVEGRPPDTFYMLLEGVVGAEAEGHAEVHYGPGAAFDLEAMRERRAAQATITAQSPVQMLVMSHAQFRAVRALTWLRQLGSLRPPASVTNHASRGTTLVAPSGSRTPSFIQRRG